MAPFLGQDLHKKLIGILGSEATTFKQIAQAFDSTFTHEQLAVALTLHERMESDGASQNNMGGDVDNHVRHINGIYILHLIIKGNKGVKNTAFSSAPVAAKAALHRMFQRLETNLRDDSKRAEQWRMRANAKDNAVKSKTAGRDAGLADTMRFRLVIKGFGFRCLLDKVDVEASAIKLLGADQKEVDAQLDQFATQNGAELREALRDLGVAYDAEPMLSFGTLSSKTVKGIANDGVPSWESYSPVFATLAPSPMHNPRPGELHQALTTQMSALALLDTDPLSAKWKAARDGVVAASTSSIKDAQQKDLVKAIGADGVPATAVGLSPAVFADIAQKNPATAVALVPQLPASHLSAYTYALLVSGKADIPTMNGVLAAAASSAKQQTITKYITAVGKALDSASDKQAAVKGFATTLHQLVEKRPDIFSASDKACAAAIFKDYTSIPEVTTHWSSIIN